jgi:hypothetical protein
MAKSHRRRNNIVKNITKSANKALPVVNKGLETVGNTAKDVAVKSAPVIKKGVSAVYGTLATGLDLGIKGAKTVARDISKSKIVRSRKSRSKKGGKSKRRHNTHRH